MLDDERSARLFFEARRSNVCAFIFVFTVQYTVYEGAAPAPARSIFFRACAFLS
jgi:hypothetical protein